MVDRYQRGSRAWKDALINGPGIERSYLAFDGVTDRGFASGAMSGIGTSYTVAQRVWRPLSSGAAQAHFQTLGVAGAGTAASTDYVRRQGSTNLYWEGRSEANAILWGGGIEPASQVTTEAKVLAIKRTTSVAPKTRLLRASGVEYTGAWGSHVMRTPHSVSVGYALEVDGTPFAAPGPITLLSQIVTVGEATDAQLVRYCAGEDPRAIWGASLWSYWPSSMMYHDGSNWRLPSLGSDKTTMLLTGPTSADLVAI